MTPEEIRNLRAREPDLRSKDFADQHGVSEAEFTAAFVGQMATKISANPEVVLPKVPTLGRVMALTRNASAVHEKKGIYGEYRHGKFAGIIIHDQIDLRIFHRHWISGFAWREETEKGIKRSLQFFDHAGNAVHKIHALEDTNLQNWDTLVDEIALTQQSDSLSVKPYEIAELIEPSQEAINTLRDRWGRMTDVHQFVSILKKLDMTRHQAVHAGGEQFTRRVRVDAVGEFLTRAAQSDVPIMCFVGNRGCIQIHTGPIETVKPMGPWQNILDPGFNLHLRADHVAEAWVVQKPTDTEYVTSLEFYDDDGQIITQFFGKRGEGNVELNAWRSLLATLPDYNKA